MHLGSVVLIGAVHEAQPALRALVEDPRVTVSTVVTLSEERAKSVSGFVDLVGTASEAGIPVMRVDNVNSPDSVDAIKALAPDLLVVVGWTRLIHENLLSVPRHGCIGFHASMLPRHRGRAPVNWSIIRGESSTGNTMMLLNSGVDTGAVVDQRETPIYVDDTCATVYDRVAELGASMLVANLEPLLTGSAQLKLQDESVGDTLPKRTPSMGITDWTKSPMDVHNWIRAQTRPYPGAFTYLSGGRVTLWATEPPTRSHHALAVGSSACHTPGTILSAEGGSLLVATGGSGAVRVTDFDAEGGEPDIRPGMRFECPDAATSLWAHGLGPEPDTMQGDLR